MIRFFKTNYSYLIVLLFAILYCMFLSNNPTTDSYAYAVSSLSGKDLIYPHHLLYTPLCYVIIRAFAFTGLEAIKILQIFNVLLSCLSLLVLRKILKKVHNKESIVASVIMFCGSCYGFLRFAIDNEVYILFLLFSLLAIYYMQTFLAENSLKELIKLSVCLLLACLSFQMGILLWVPTLFILIYLRKKRNLIVFLLISLVIPLVYCVISYLTMGYFSIGFLMKFVLNDYYQGTASGPILKQVLFLTPISLVRTFVQVHGTMITILKVHKLISLVVIAVCFALFILGLIKIKKSTKRNSALSVENLFVRYCISIAVLVFLFAAFSNGNAEFMVLLPFVLVIILMYKRERLGFIFYFACGLLIWNTYFALIPTHNKNYNCNTQIVRYIHSHPQYSYILFDKPTIENQYNYLYFPDTLSFAKKDTSLTDCFADKRPLSRGSLLSKDFPFKKDSLFVTFYSDLDTITLYSIKEREE